MKAQEFFRLLDGGVQDGLFSTVLDKAGQDAATRKLDLTEAFWRPVVEAERAIPNKCKNTWTDTLEGHPLRNPQRRTGRAEAPRPDRPGPPYGHPFQLRMAKGWGVIEQDAVPMRSPARAVSSSSGLTARWTRLNGCMCKPNGAHMNACGRNTSPSRARSRALNQKPSRRRRCRSRKAGPLAGGYAPVSYHPDL